MPFDLGPVHIEVGDLIGPGHSPPKHTAEHGANCLLNRIFSSSSKIFKFMFGSPFGVVNGYSMLVVDGPGPLG